MHLLGLCVFGRYGIIGFIFESVKLQSTGGADGKLPKTNLGHDSLRRLSSEQIMKLA